jgi:hypothetical protein
MVIKNGGAQALCLRGRGKGSCHENPSTLEVEITLVRGEAGVQLQWATAPPVLMQEMGSMHFR